MKIIKKSTGKKIKNYDRKIFRLLSILKKMDSNRSVSTGQLAEEFNVTKRTVQRDIELLDMVGFPIISSRGRHSFVEGFSLKKIMLFKEEASLLSLFYEVAKNMGNNFEEVFQGIFRKLLLKNKKSPFYIKIPQGIRLESNFPYLKELKYAIEECRKIKVVYETGTKELKTYYLKPLKIIFFDGFWYLLSQVEGKKWILKFRMERIREVNLLNDYFNPPENLKLILDKSVNIWFSEEQDKKIVLKISKEVANFFKEKNYFPYQKIVKRDKDGSLTVESKVSKYQEVIPTIMHWIPNIKVLSPPELKKNLQNTIKSYLTSF